jgi:hypothetical protein
MPGEKLIDWTPTRSRLWAVIAPLLIAGIIGIALAVASGTTSVSVSENLCTSGGGNVRTMGANGSTVMAALAPAHPVAAQIPVYACTHPREVEGQPTTANRIGSRYRLHPISGKFTESEVSDGDRFDSV